MKATAVGVNRSSKVSKTSKVNKQLAKKPSQPKSTSDTANTVNTGDNSLGATPRRVQAGNPVQGPSLWSGAKLEKGLTEPVKAEKSEKVGKPRPKSLLFTRSYVMNATTRFMNEAINTSFEKTSARLVELADDPVKSREVMKTFIALQTLRNHVKLFVENNPDLFKDAPDTPDVSGTPDAPVAV